MDAAIALDDFGSGMSSFPYLKEIPLDYLKIDGQFVRNMLDEIIVKSINDIGKSMGKKVIAEFVENESILNRLREFDVGYAQGYGIGHPVPLIELEAPVAVEDKAVYV